MNITNLILIGVGCLVALIGIATIFNPNLAKWINAPGSPLLKALIAIVVGIILIFIGSIIQLPIT